MSLLFVTVNKGLSPFLTDGFCITCSAGHSQGRAARSRAMTPSLCRHPGLQGLSQRLQGSFGLGDVGQLSDSPRVFLLWFLSQERKCVRTPCSSVPGQVEVLVFCSRGTSSGPIAAPSPAPPRALSCSGTHELLLLSHGHDFAKGENKLHQFPAVALGWAEVGMRSWQFSAFRWLGHSWHLPALPWDHRLCRAVPIRERSPRQRLLPLGGLGRPGEAAAWAEVERGAKNT